MFVQHAEDDQTRESKTGAEGVNRQAGDENLAAWLNLSLGRRESPTATTGDSDSQLKTGSNKVSSCNFCMRKFLSASPFTQSRRSDGPLKIECSQSVGGHPNAHKRERGMAKRSHCRSLSMLSSPLNPPMNVRMIRSMGVRPHSVVHKAHREALGTAVRFSDTIPGFGMSWTPSSIEEAVDALWPGTSPDLYTLDLNLRL